MTAQWGEFAPGAGDHDATAPQRHACDTQAPRMQHNQATHTGKGQSMATTPPGVQQAPSPLRTARKPSLDFGNAELVPPPPCPPPRASPYARPPVREEVRWRFPIVLRRSSRRGERGCVHEMGLGTRCTANFVPSCCCPLIRIHIVVVTISMPLHTTKPHYRDATSPPKRPACLPVVGAA